MALALSAGTCTAALAADKKTQKKISTTLPLEGTVVKANDARIQYVGRVTFVNPNKKDGPQTDVAYFNYPGTTIQTRFTGSSLRMVCRPKTGYFMAQVDGAKAFKVAFNSDRDSVVNIATALPEGEHSVRLMYISEGVFANPEFKAFVLDEGASLRTPAPLPERKIEFIGNSITCGYGVESTEKTDRFELETENHWMTYANIVSDSLHAQHTSISRSGIGAYRNYNGPKAGSPDKMASQYEYTLFNKHNEKWDFSRYQPQLVCINLGTNDLSTPNYDLTLFEKSYRSFLATVRSKYPDAKIVLLAGSMLGEKEHNLQREVLDRIAKDEKNVYRFDFSRQTGDLGYGAGWHPSRLQQKRMADELLPYLKQLMGW